MENTKGDEEDINEEDEEEDRNDDGEEEERNGDVEEEEEDDSVDEDGEEGEVAGVEGEDESAVEQARRQASTKVSLPRSQALPEESGYYNDSKLYGFTAQPIFRSSQSYKFVRNYESTAKNGIRGKYGTGGRRGRDRCG